MALISRLRSLAVLSVSGAFLLSGVAPALAQAPGNDDFDSATTITALPYTDALNTSEATTAADDPDCLGNGHTVWYAFTAPGEMGIDANTFGSDYDTTLSVYTGVRGSLTQIACNDDSGDGVQSRVRFNTVGGETYFFMVGSFLQSPGGSLSFSTEEIPLLPPPIEVGIIIDPTGTVVIKTGEVTVHGSVTCSRDVVLDMFGDVRQTLGRFFIRGFFEIGVECAGGSATWSATLTGETGKFGPGRARVVIDVFGFDEERGEEVFAHAEARVRLVRA